MIDKNIIQVDYIKFILNFNKIYYINKKVTNCINSNITSIESKGKILNWRNETKVHAMYYA